MARKKKHDEAHENHERWLITYSDLITLLMVFFVVMYSMSNLDSAKYKKIASSLNTSMGNGRSMIGKDKNISTTEETKPIDNALIEENKLAEAKKQIDDYVKQNGLEGQVATAIQARGLVLTFKDVTLFDTGKADVRPSNMTRLIEIGKILSKMNNQIIVEGHTDNVQISGGPFASNWELSSVRATTVTKILQSRAGIPGDRISALGYGEYRPVGDNNTEAGRAQNRRVNILVLNTKLNDVTGK